ncbi:RHS repeat-associated core domain-containing protein [Burkholderia stagnalis]|uniref:RHS repeat-associated core domain-containing protein n=1 Tax=Burkholderia stagnalis TaxID=1503054 RepID=UPI0009BE3960|nr:RHS repeat-associated core domain-containing protein [Burkholderia stagnalis]
MTVLDKLLRFAAATGVRIGTVCAAAVITILLVPSISFAQGIGISCCASEPTGDEGQFGPIDSGGGSVDFNPFFPPFQPPQTSSADLMYSVDDLISKVVPPVGVPVPQGDALQTTLPGTRGAADRGVVAGTEPVIGNGEFVLDETDLSFAGYGLPFQFTRHYRSGVTFRTPLGAGWSHSFQQRIVVGNSTDTSCSPQYPDVYYISDRQERIRFMQRTVTNGPNGLDVLYATDASNRMVLDYYPEGDPSETWILRDGLGLAYVFDGAFGNLVSVRDPVGHSIDITWDHSNWKEIGGKITRVTDTTGRIIYFNYEPEVPGPEGARRNNALSCLSLEPDCTKPLVSFQYDPRDFDLVRALDSNGEGRRYAYFAYQPGLARPWVADARLGEFCSTACGTKEQDCHNYDVCRLAADPAIRTACRPIGLAFGDKQNSCEAYCAQSCANVDYCPYTDGGDQILCTNVQLQSYCSHPENAANSNCLTAGNIRDVCAQEEADCETAGQARAATDRPACAQMCAADCFAKKGALDDNGVRRYAYGVPQDLHHKLIDVFDGDNRLVIHNDYGIDPFAPSFNRVIAHQQGVGRDNVMKFEYHDLKRELLGEGQPNAARVTPITAFNGVAICPHHCVRSHVEFGVESGEPIKVCDDYGLNFDAGNVVPGADYWFQRPTWAVVVTDVGNVVRTDYYDDAWRLVREVNHSVVRTRNYNYAGGLLVGAQHEGGNRTCLDYDAMGHPTRITELPAPGLAGNPQITEYSYDDAGELIEEVHNPEGQAPYGRQFIRDAWERVIAIGQQVDTTNAEWTCFEYHDPRLRYPFAPRRHRKLKPSGASGRPTWWIQSSLAAVMNAHPTRQSPPLPHERSVSLAITALLAKLDSARALPLGAGRRDAAQYRPWTTGMSRRDVVARVPPGLVYFNPLIFMFRPSGCATSLSHATTFARSRNALPSVITRPDGSIVKLTGLEAGGPRNVVIDAKGADPLETYAAYDEFGRITETGKKVGGTVVPGSRSRASYDSAERLMSFGSEDPNHPGTYVDSIYHYDHSRHLVGIDGPTFRRDYTVDALGQVLRIKDTPNASYASTTQPRATCFVNDIHGKTLKKILPEGNVEKYVYDGAGDLIEIWKGYETGLKVGGPKLDLCPEILAPPTLPGVPPLTTTARRHPRRVAHPLAQPQAAFSSMEKVASFTYDKGGFLAGALLNGVDLHYQVDGFGRVIDTIVPDHTGVAIVPSGPGGFRPVPVTVFFHWARGIDDNGNVAWEGIFDDPPGNDKPTGLIPGIHALTEYESDLLGRRTKMSQWRFTEQPLAPDPAGLLATTTIVRDDAHGTITTTDPEGRVSVVDFDGVGRPLHVSTGSSGDQINAAYTYTRGGSVVTVATSPAPAKSGKLERTYTFGPRDTIATIAEAGRTIFSQITDSLDRPLSRTLPLTGTQSVQYDGYGRVVVDQSVVDSNKTITIGYSWNGNDRMQGVTDGEGHTTRFTYDRVDRLSGITSGANLWLRTYVPGTDRLATRKDPAGTLQVFGYDLGGRLVTREAIDGPGMAVSGTRTFSYTPRGELSSAILDGSGGKQTVALTYDSLGRKLSESNDALPLSIAHTYAPGSVTTSLVRNGTAAASFTTQYDTLDRPTGLSLGPNAIAIFDYAQGALAKISFGNQVIGAMLHDARARVAGMNLTLNGAPVASTMVIRGIDDNIHQRQRTFGTQPPLSDLFKVDGYGRVTSENRQVPNVTLIPGDATNSDVDARWSNAAPSSAWALDDAANWIARTGVGAMQPTIDSLNRYTAINATLVGYDKAGDVLAFGNEAYAWSGIGELVSAIGGGSTLTFTYDALGRRIRESDGTTTNFVVWDGARLLAMGPVNNVGSTRVRLGVGLYDTLALVDNLGAGPVRYLHADTEGSVFAATNAMGALIEGYAYSAYGETTFLDSGKTEATQSSFGNRFLFQGQLYDPALAFYSMGAREYRPTWGRFLSPDPIGLGGGLNLYAFGDARPLTFADPTGLSPGFNPASLQLKLQPYNWYRPPIDLDAAVQSRPKSIIEEFARDYAQQTGDNPSLWNYVRMGDIVLTKELGREFANIGNVALGAVGVLGSVLHKVDPENAIATEFSMMPHAWPLVAAAVDYVRAAAAAEPVVYGAISREAYATDQFMASNEAELARRYAISTADVGRLSGGRFMNTIAVGYGSEGWVAMSRFGWITAEQEAFLEQSGIKYLRGLGTGALHPDIQLMLYSKMEVVAASIPMCAACRAAAFRWGSGYIPYTELLQNRFFLQLPWRGWGKF